MEISSPVTSRRAGARGTERGGGECTMVAAPPAFLPLVRGTPSERRPGGSAGLGSSLLATATRLRMVALHSSSFPLVGGKSRSNCARASASTSDHVRRSSITTARSHAIFTSASASGQVFYLPGVALGVFPAATPGVFGAITPLVTRRLRGTRRRRRSGSPGGPRAASGRGSSDLRRSRATCGGPDSVFGFGGVRPVTGRTNIAASQTPAAGTVLVFANSAPGPFGDWSAARPRRDGMPGVRRANRHHRLLLGRHDDEEALN